MKLQHLTVIFVIIVLPITLILSAYTRAQIDILTLQNQYDDMLLTSTYDGIKAFQINASYNSLSNVSDALREDVESAVSAFMQSLAVKMGVGGYNINHMKTYVPAILFTLYDGYYIYAPAKTTDKEGKTVYEYMLKPYNYYTVRYKQNEQNDVVINYTLDNYIVVYGWIGGKYVVNSGYLVLNDRRENDGIEGTEKLYEYAPYKGTAQDSEVVIPDYNYSVANLPENITKSIYSPNYLETLPSGTKDPRDYCLYPRNDNYYVNPESAKKYYEEAATFTTWVENNLKDWVTSDIAMRNNKYLNQTYSDDIDYDEFSEANKKNIFNFNTPDNDPEDETSIFAQHKTAVIRSSIQDNLNQSITAYSQGNTSSYEYKLPKLEINEWDMVSNNVCMLTFLQGIPMKTKYYNNYALVQSTRNNLYVSKDSLYFISDANGDGKADDGYYHKIDCPHLPNTDTITGYSNFDFLPKKLNLKDEDAYYKHYEQGCYYCIVDSTNYEKINWEEDSTFANRKKAYYTALAREKYRRYTATGHLNNVT